MAESLASNESLIEILELKINLREDRLKAEYRRRGFLVIQKICILQKENFLLGPTQPNEEDTTVTTKVNNKQRKRKKSTGLSVDKALEEKRRKSRERTRKYKAKLSEEKLQQKIKYDIEYKAKRMAEGLWEFRKYMSEKDKEEARKQNRERVQKCRKRKSLDNEKQVRSRDESVNSNIGLISIKEEVKEEYEQMLST